MTSVSASLDGGLGFGEVDTPVDGPFLAISEGGAYETSASSSQTLWATQPPGTPFYVTQQEIDFLGAYDWNGYVADRNAGGSDADNALLASLRATFGRERGDAIFAHLHSGQLGSGTLEGGTFLGAIVKESTQGGTILAFSPLDYIVNSFVEGLQADSLGYTFTATVRFENGTETTVSVVAPTQDAAAESLALSLGALLNVNSPDVFPPDMQLLVVAPRPNDDWHTAIFGSPSKPLVPLIINFQVVPANGAAGQQTDVAPTGPVRNRDLEERHDEGLSDSTFALATSFLAATGGEIPENWGVPEFIAFVFGFNGYGDLTGSPEWAQFLEVNGLTGSTFSGDISNLDTSMFDKYFEGGVGPDFVRFVSEGTILSNTFQSMAKSGETTFSRKVFDAHFDQAALSVAGRSLVVNPYRDGAGTLAERGGERAGERVGGRFFSRAAGAALGALLGGAASFLTDAVPNVSFVSWAADKEGAIVHPEDNATVVVKDRPAVSTTARFDYEAAPILFNVEHFLSAGDVKGATQYLMDLEATGTNPDTLNVVLDGLDPQARASILAELRFNVTESSGTTNYFTALAEGRPYSALEDRAMDEGPNTQGVFDGFMASGETPTELASNLVGFPPFVAGLIIVQWMNLQNSGGDDRFSAADFAEFLSTFRHLAPDDFNAAMSYIAETDIPALVKALETISALGADSISPEARDGLIAGIIDTLRPNLRVPVLEALTKTEGLADLGTALKGPDAPSWWAAVSAEVKEATFETIDTNTVVYSFIDEPSGAEIEIITPLGQQPIYTADGIINPGGAELQVRVNGKVVDVLQVYAGWNPEGTAMVWGIQVANDPGAEGPGTITYFAAVPPSENFIPPVGLTLLANQAQTDGNYTALHDLLTEGLTQAQQEAANDFAAFQFVQEGRENQHAELTAEAGEAWNEIKDSDEVREITDQGTDYLVENGVMVTGDLMEFLGIIPPGESDDQMLYFIPPSSELQDAFNELGLGDITQDKIFTLPEGHRQTAWGASGYLFKGTFQLTEISDHWFVSERPSTTVPGKMDSKRLSLRVCYTGIRLGGIEEWVTSRAGLDQRYSLPFNAVGSVKVFAANYNSATSEQRAEWDFRGVVAELKPQLIVILNLRYGNIWAKPHGRENYFFGEGDIVTGFAGGLSNSPQGGEGVKVAGSFASGFEWGHGGAVNFRYRTYFKGKMADFTRPMMGVWSMLASTLRWTMGTEDPTYLLGYEYTAAGAVGLATGNENGNEGASASFSVSGKSFAILVVKPEEFGGRFGAFAPYVVAGTLQLLTTIYTQVAAAGRGHAAGEPNVVFLPPDGQGGQWYTNLDSPILVRWTNWVLSLFGPSIFVPRGAVNAYVWHDQTSGEVYSVSPTADGGYVSIRDFNSPEGSSTWTGTFTDFRQRTGNAAAGNLAVSLVNALIAGGEDQQEFFRQHGGALVQVDARRSDTVPGRGDVPGSYPVHPVHNPPVLNPNGGFGPFSYHGPRFLWYVTLNEFGGLSFNWFADPATPGVGLRGSIPPSEQPSINPVGSGQPSDSPTISGQPSVSPTISGQPSGSPTISGQPSGSPTISGQPSNNPTTTQEPTLVDQGE